MKSVLRDGRRPKVGGLSKMLIRQRFSVIGELIEASTDRPEIVEVLAKFG